MTIRIAKIDYPISFGFGAIMAYEQATGTPVLALFESFQRGDARFTDILHLIACGLNNGARKVGNPTVYSAEQVADLLDESENAMQVVTDCMQLLAGSFAQEPAKKKTVTLAANRETRRKAS